MPTSDLDHLLCRLWFPTRTDVMALGKALKQTPPTFGSIQACRGWLYRALRESHKWSAWDLLLCETLSPTTVRRLWDSTQWRGRARCYVVGDAGREEVERMPASSLRAPLGRMLENSAEERWEQVEVEISRARTLLEPCAATEDTVCLRAPWTAFQRMLDAYLGSSTGGPRPSFEEIARAARDLRTVDVVAFALTNHFVRASGGSAGHGSVDPREVWRWLQMLLPEVQGTETGVRELVRALRPFLEGIDRARATQFVDRLVGGSARPPAPPPRPRERLLDERRREAARGLSWSSMVCILAGPGVELPDDLEHRSKGLFPHQEAAIGSLDEWWTSDQGHGALCLPTGAGKTRVGVHFVLTRALQRGKVLWLAHRTELCDQAVATFAELSAEAPRGFAIGRFEAGMKKVRRPVDVVVASIPTLARSTNLDRLFERVGSDFCLVVIDECHHAAASTWSRLLFEMQERLPALRRLGLSATPTRTDERERARLWHVLGELVHEERLLPLIKAQILSKPEIRLIDTGCTYEADDHDRTFFGEHRTLSPKLVDKIVATEERNRVVIDTYVEGRDGWGPSLVFCEKVEQAWFVADELVRQGVRAKAVLGETPAKERQEVISAFRDGQIEVLVNVGVLTEGTDLPRVATVFIARPTRSRILFQQMVGRAMRGPKVGGSAQCTVVGFYDHVHGLLDRALATTFADEAEAYIALGFEEGSLEEDPDEVDEEGEKGEEKAKEPPIPGMLLEEIRSALANVHPAAKLDVSALIGWWEAVDGEGHRRALPVFEGLRHDAERWVASLRSKGAGDTEPPDSLDQTFDQEQLVRFIRAVRSADAPPRFVDLAMLPEFDRTMLTREHALPVDGIEEPERTDLEPEPEPTRLHHIGKEPAERKPHAGWLAAAREASSKGDVAVVRVGSSARAFSRRAVDTARDVAHFCRGDLERGRVDVALALAKGRLRDLGHDDDECDLLAKAILVEGAIDQSRPSLEEAARELPPPGTREWEASIELLHQVYFDEDFGSPLAFVSALMAATVVR